MALAFEYVPTLNLARGILCSAGDGAPLGPIEGLADIGKTGAMPRLRVITAPRKALAAAAKNTSYNIGIDALAATYTKRKAAKRLEEHPFRLPAFPPDCVPPKGNGLAMDETPLSSVTAWAAQQAIASVWAEGMQFLGYTYLSELAQRTEYRVMSEVIAEEMTRKWIRFQARGDKDKTEKISELKDFLDNMKLQAAFHQTALLDGLMGRAHIYIDTGQSSTPDELQTPIGNGRDDITKSKVGKGKLRGFKVIEPIWAYPLTYNSSDPLADDWYRPEQWYAMSRAIHRSRLLTFVGRPVPDILKPAYAFGGLSLSQMAKPYVDNWLRTRQSVSDLVHSFTVFKLGTDMSALMMDQGDQLFRRMELFNNLRDNNNLFLHDKDTEEFDNTSAPLGTLDTLLNKAQEQMAAVPRIPLVKFLGISPGGLNASSEGEIAMFYDTIGASQERLFRPNLTTCIDFAQMSLWGEVDPDIVFVFEPLRALSRKEEAEVRKTDAETGQILVTGGVISQEEERTRVAADPDMPYQGLDPNDVPDLQEEEEAGLAVPGAGGAEKAILENANGELGGEGDKPRPDSEKQKTGGDKPKSDSDKGNSEAAKDGVIPFPGLPFDAAFDAEWSEADHDRQSDGKFGAGGGASSSGPKKIGGAVGRARQFLKSDALRTAVQNVAGTLKQNHKAILAAAIVAAVTKIAGGYISPELEETISHQVENFAQHAGVTIGEARNKMRAIASKLISLRGPTLPAQDSAEADEVLAALIRYRDGFGASDDGEFKEGDHPRAPDGKFGSGSGSPSKGAPAKSSSSLIKKAAKGTKVIPSGVKGASELEAAFNERWAGKELTDEGEIDKKISDYGQLKKGITKLKSEGSKGGEEDPQWLKDYLKDWHKSGSVGGQNQPSKKKVDAYTKAWQDTAPSVVAPEKPGAPLKESDLKRVGKQMGSNPGGVFEDKSGQRFYVKQGKSKAHVDTELAAADLYKLAGTPTLDYQAVEGGKHIATKMEKLDADRLSKLSPAERKKAQDDFVTHAWLANWDAVGLGGDNIGTVNGVPTALDLGGALAYRAMGAPKGDKFGATVGELDTLRSKAMNPDAASLYGGMSDADMRQSAKKVLAIPDKAIRKTIEQRGLGSDLADKLIARKKDIAKRLGGAAADSVGKLIETGPDVFSTEGGYGPAAFEDWEDEEPIAGDRLDAYRSVGIDVENLNPDGSDYHLMNAMDEFTEGKHPRVKGGKNAGQFAPGGGGGGGPASEGAEKKDKKEKPKLPEGVKSKKEHVGNLLKKGVTAKEVLEATGWPSVSMPQVAKSLGVTLVKKKEGGVTKYYSEATGAAPAADPDPEPPPTLKYEPPPKPKAPDPEPEPPKPKIKQSVGQSVLNMLSEAFSGPKEQPKYKAPQATPEEAKKASKATKVPSTASPVANKAIDLFNAKYANTPVSSPEAINQKVADYKQLQKDIAEGQKAAQAEQAAAALEAVKKKAEQEKAEAEAAAKEANDPKVKRHLAALKAIGASSNLSYAKERIKAAGLEGKISPAHASAIIAYTGSHYGSVNKEMRTGAMTQEQWNYAKALNDALDKLPPHVGVTKRGTTIPAAQLAQYQPGVIIEERAFTSTGKGSKFSGPVSFEIHGKTGRDVSKLSSHSSENEVLFKSGTRFKVVSRSGNHIVMHEA